MVHRAAHVGILAVLLFAALGSAGQPGRAAQAAPQADLTFTVNDIADRPANTPYTDGVCDTPLGNSDCTLRAAIMKANNWHLGSVTVILPALPAGQAYFLTIPPSGGDGDDTGDLNILPSSGRPSVTIQGGGPANTIIDASGMVPGDRVLSIGAGAVATISLVTMRGGRSGHGAGINNDGSLTLFGSNVIFNQAVAGGPDIGEGGGLYNSGAATLLDDFVGNNSAEGETGGIHNNLGVLTLTNSILSANTTGGLAGGIWNDHGSLTLNQTEINGNSGQYGGGIRNVQGAVTATASSLVYNFTNAGGGGALYNYCGPVVLVDSTVSSNSADTSGGGVYNEDSGSACGTLLDLRSTTIAANRAAIGGSGQGGGIFSTANSTVAFRNTILSNNELGAGAFNPSDCAGPGALDSLGFNLISSLAGCNNPTLTTGDIPNQFALLRPLAFNGGITLNHALNPGSPAVDAGLPTGCFDTLGFRLSTDQRGAPRVAFGGHSFHCDIGAFELQQTLDLPLLVR